ncbi:stimulated by retinoic acid gene 6 protein-like isoform X2 [Lytechinus variegatus]|uniref:stimulated by retinoic acid gene 6 protein-like isoform X2 n=1 Tax=Lytechinus variegatus TaxID=7654 RepID=UPI001BB0F167|nr:stimulated by retinoic acid gene 6 protein-like isoform X2 [Lytechinus variegatus]
MSASRIMGVFNGLHHGGNGTPSHPDMNIQLTASTNCTRGPDWTLFIHCCIPPSLIIFLILSFFGKMYNYRLRSLFGIKQLAVVFPINLLDDHEHRWSHALAFGATASIIFDLFSGDYTSLYVKTGQVEPWLKIFLGAVATIELGTVLFPFFACISSPSLFVGSLLGFIYVAIWFSVQLSHIITCPNIDGGKGFPYESVIIQLPVLIFTFLLMIRFLYFLIISIMKKIQNTKISSEEKLMQSYQAQHVQALLRPPLPPRIYTKRWEMIAYHWYEPTQNFIYPTRIICTFVVAVLCEYQIAIRTTYGLDQALSNAFKKFREWYTVFVISEDIPPATANQTYLALDRYETAAHVSWYLACALSIAISLLYIAHIFVCFRKHVLRLYKGDRKFLPDASLNSVKSMTGSLQYCGFQIAYYLSGYVIMNVMWFVVIYVISGAVVIPLIKNAWAFISGFLNVVVPLFAVAFLVFGSQPLLAKRVFLQPKLDQNDKDKPLALQHRDFYHIFSYFLVFLNVIVGMLSCVIRILTGLFVGVFLLCRIDRPILMRGYEHLDQSYQAYIGNLNMINAHSHPVVVVFCQILVNRIISRKRAKLGRGGASDLAASYSFVEHDVESISPHARATMRWQLAYTLLFNPSLLGTRKRSRQMSYKEMEKRILKVATLLPHRQQVLKRSKEAFPGGQIGLVGPTGRVRSAPGLFLNHQEDDKLAAMLLNRELMDDRSDVEEDIPEEVNDVEVVEVKVKDDAAETIRNQGGDEGKRSGFESRVEDDVVGNSVHHGMKSKRGTGELNELTHLSQFSQDSQSSKDTDKNSSNAHHNEQASGKHVNDNVVDDTIDDADVCAQEPSKIVVYLDGPSSSSTEDHDHTKSKDHL